MIAAGSAELIATVRARKTADHRVRKLDAQFG
jgi:hypothetical protein